MTDQYEDVDERLERLARATSGLHARAGMRDRILLAAQATAVPGWLEAVTMSAKAGLAVAILAVAAAVTIAVQSERLADEASAVAYGALELSW